MISDMQIYYVQVSLATFGMFINISSILTHFLIPGLRKHPGSIIVMILLSQAIFLTHWIFTFPYSIQ